MEVGKRRRAAVVVLGDIGRSPPMQYHALSLARQRLWPSRDGVLPKMFHPVMLLLKPLIQFIMLLWFLCVKIKGPRCIHSAGELENPPSAPTLVAVKWASWLRQSSFIIDWHNFGYTLLALSLGRSSCFVAVYQCITELVKVDKNGLLFSSSSSSSSELADELMMLFKGFPDGCDALKTLRNGVVCIFEMFNL